jgi:tetratricopeptide (TPR) repeat protein
MAESLTPHDAIQAAIVHQRAGRLAEAETIYQQILQENPEHAAATRMLGILFSQRRDYPRAIELLNRAVTLSGKNPAILLDLAVVYRAAGQPDHVERTYRSALEVTPPFPRAFKAFAQYLRETGRSRDAVSVVTRLTESDPSWDSLHLLGMTLAGSLRFAEAIGVFERCIAIAPQNAAAFNSIGACYLSMDQPRKAEEFLRKAVQRDPRNSEAIYNLGSAMMRQNRHRDAIAALEQVIALRPDFALAHANVAGALIALGDWKRGWEEFEWRLKVPGSKPPDPRTAQKMWQGEPLQGQPILLISEGGLGDGIQFSRYAPLVAGRGGRATLLCQPPLARLMRSLKDVERVVTPSDAIGSFEQYCPLMSLPHLFGTVPENVPSADAAFLSAEADDVKRWGEKLGAADFGIKRIGIVWAGNPENLMDMSRSIPFDALAPLASIEGVKFYSLQKGPRGQPITRPVSGLPMIDHTADLHDMAETAALLQNLDLLLTADTAVAHVAAATGRPTWFMLAHSPDPRWMVEREDTPWYTNVRLFRQDTPGNWVGLVQRVAGELSQWARHQ